MIVTSRPSFSRRRLTRHARFAVPGRVALGTALCLLAAGVHAVAGGDAIQSLESIQASVERFVSQVHANDATLGVKVRTLDDRLRLPECATALEAAWSPGSRDTGSVTVLVRCPAPRPWQLHVQADVTRDASVWVLRRAVQRSEQLSATLVEQRRVTLGRDLALASRSGTPVDALEPWLGFAFRQAAQPGQLLTQRMLEPRTLVSRGEKVRIRHRGSGLRIEAAGVALADGVLDERIQIRNPNSGKVVEAVVAAPGVVNPL